ncbi:MAG: N-acetyltransferase family protein [Pseudorhodobacter sp.]|nr:N-acetyltransferase family protein [Pseudorhodobacter sp.]
MIRPARPADLPAIMAFWNPLIRDTLVTFNPVEKSLPDMEAMLAAKAAAGQAFVVAEHAGAVVGFATYGPFRSGPGYAHTAEHTIILSDAARGQGLGRALLMALEDHVRAAGVHSLFAGVSGGNPAGRAFHAAMGYQLAATLPEVGFKFGRWWDLWLMQKFLT